MAEISNDTLDTFKRLLLEAENLIERVEEDEHSRIAWICERESLEEIIQEVRDFFWPKEEDIAEQEDR